MTQNRRIVLNIAATYGRSLYALAIGLFCGRWALMALGQVDYGLFGLVGGLTAIVSFLNELLSMAVARFYAVAVGFARKSANVDSGIENCRKWFNTALCLHLIIPSALLVVGYPIGEWMVRCFLTIPANRIESCVWVWRFTCFACYVGMANVPFRAMYTAKQEIAELTIYGVASSTVNVVILYYMITHPGKWLVEYAFSMMLISLVPNICMCCMAIVRYPECRMVKAYLFDWNRTREILKFALARFWTVFAHMVSSQGNAILVNKYLGPAFNASMAIGNTVASHAATLSGSLSHALWPVIGNKSGENDIEGVRKFAFQTCRLGSILVLIFAIPLALEVDEVMILWLKHPPAYVSVICIAVLIEIILERMSEGYWMAILGMGRSVGTYSGWASTVGFVRVLLAWVSFALGLGIYGLCFALICAKCWSITIRLFLGRKLVGMSVRYWLFKVLSPIALVSIVTLCFGLSSRLFMGQSFARVVVTSFMCAMFFIILIWHVVLFNDERCYIIGKFKKVFKR